MKRIVLPSLSIHLVLLCCILSIGYLNWGKSVFVHAQEILNSGDWRKPVEIDSLNKTDVSKTGNSNDSGIVPYVSSWVPLGEPGVGGWVTSVSIDPNNSDHLIIGGDLLGVGVSFDGGHHYQPGLGFQSCEIGDCTFHPTLRNVVWVGTMSGPYLSIDGGRTWQVKRTGFPRLGEYHYSAPVEKILFDPNNDQHLLAFGGSSRRWYSPGKPEWGAIWESLDAGEHWKKISSVDKNIVSASFVPGSSKELYIAVDRAGLYRSSDGGKSWETANEGLPHLNIERICVHPQMPNTIYISLNSGPLKEDEKGRKRCLTGGIFRSDDKGKTWSEKMNGMERRRDLNPNLTSGFKAFAWSVADSRILYAGDCAWNVDTIYRSTDGGETWVKVLHRNPSDPARVCTMKCAYYSGAGGTVMSIDPRDAKTVYGAGAEFVVRSKDGGVTWEDITAEKKGDLQEHCWSGRGYSGLCCTGFYYDPYHNGHSVLTAMDAGKSWESLDFMKTWTFRGSKPTPWGGGNMVAFAKDGTIYLTTGQGNSEGGVLRGKLGEHGDWIHFCGERYGLPDFKKSVATGIHVLPDDSSQVWVVIDKKLYFSQDSGEHWTLLFDKEELGWLAADPQNSRTFYLSGKDNVWKTDDGLHFMPIGGPKVTGRMTVDRLGRLLLAAYRGKNPGLWRLDGKKWTLLKKDYYAKNVAVDPTNAKRILLVGNDDPFHDKVRSSVWVSSDDGQSFYEATEGLPVLRGNAVAFNPFDSKEIVLGTGGCGFFKANFPNVSSTSKNTF